jgi:hypothetical protein
MMNRTFAALLVLVAGCSGATTDGQDTSSNELERKRIAAEQNSAGTSTGDACAENQWYGDGVCDSFCDKADTDCIPDDPNNGGDSDPVVCALFLEGSDGVCTRPGDDPCRFQDPDCESGEPVPDPDEPVACAAIIELSNGVCTRPENDPCRSQDPDCIPGDPPNGGYQCTSEVICDSLPPTCADGEVPSIQGGCWGVCVPKDECADPPPVACDSYLEASDGVCSREEGDECRFQDPDCDVACLAYIEESDGVCSREPTDPCRGQDPDCETCVVVDEESDGVCSRQPDDLCRYLDPDCDVACAEYIEEPDGECSRPPTDPCKSQDPDCI